MWCRVLFIYLLQMLLIKQIIRKQLSAMSWGSSPCLRRHEYHPSSCNLHLSGLVFLPQHIYLACVFLGQVMALLFHATFSTAEPWSFGNAAIKLLESFLIWQLCKLSLTFRDPATQQSQVSQTQSAIQEGKPDWLFGNKCLILCHSIITTRN